MEEYLTFLGDRMVDEQMMDVFAYVADNVLAGLVNKESEYDLYEKQAAGVRDSFFFPASGEFIVELILLCSLPYTWTTHQPRFHPITRGATKHS